MTLLKRIKNLWKLSGMPIDRLMFLTEDSYKEVHEKKGEQASIVSMEDPLDEFMKKVEKPNV